MHSRQCEALESFRRLPQIKCFLELFDEFSVTNIDQGNEEYVDDKT